MGDPMVKITHDGNGEVMQASRVGKPLHVVHVDLPLFVHLDINRWNEPGEGDYINAMIKMQPPGPAQDGHCGNFNGVAEDECHSRGRGSGRMPNSSLWAARGVVLSVDFCCRPRSKEFAAAEARTLSLQFEC